MLPLIHCFHIDNQMFDRYPILQKSSMLKNFKKEDNFALKNI